MTLRLGSCVFALLLGHGWVSTAQAQIPGGGAPPAGRYPVAQADFETPSGPTRKSETMVDAYGQPAILPVQYCESCPPMGGAGYGAYPCADDCMPDAFGGASLNVDQCGPHYFDFAIEGLYWRRDELGNRTIDFTSANIGGPIILSTGATDPVPANFQVFGGIENESEPGFRLTGRLDIGALSVAELIFTGFYDLESSATAIDLFPQTPTQGNLFSLFSLFGIDPPGGTNMPETEQAVLHRLEFESDYHSAELSFRRYWVGHSPRVSGTLLAGFRYAQLRESLGFHTEADGTFDLITIADNDLAGFQIGVDAWYTIVQGLRIGTEGKAGIYNNQTEVINSGVSSDGTPSINERFDDDQLAFIGEQRVDLVADVLPSVSIKVGVEALFINSVVLAVENFNTGSPYPGEGPVRVPFVADQGDALYYGYHAGIEYVW